MRSDWPRSDGAHPFASGQPNSSPSDFIKCSPELLEECSSRGQIRKAPAVIMLAIAWLWLASPSFAQPAHQAPLDPAATPGLVTIETGNKFQELIASSATERRMLRIINNNANGDSCWIFVGGGRASKENSDVVLAPGH
jgi:hypothetical protein